VGTTRGGALLDCAPTGNCVYVNWPAPIRGAYHQGDATGGDWVGSLIPGMQDASGLLYKRNRYYSPDTGQFTQTDPIGLAGGLNTYGFGEGDPVTYHDPYGLRPDTLHARNQAAADALAAIVVLALLAIESGDASVAHSGRETLRMISDLHASTTNVVFMVDPNQGKSATGPMKDGSGVGSLVNSNQSTKRVIPVRAVHELGHAWAMVMEGATDEENPAHVAVQFQTSLRYENHMRNIYNCVPRRMHGTDSDYQNPPCQP